MSDLFLIAGKLKRTAFIPFFSNILKHRIRRVEDVWRKVEQPPIAWYHIPVVRKRKGTDGIISRLRDRAKSHEMAGFRFI
jgi:hypothetical protein